MTAVNVVSLLLVAVALTVAMGVVWARVERRREAREDRADYAARAARRDFAATTAAGLLETVDQWAARTGNAVPDRPIARLPHATGDER